MKTARKMITSTASIRTKFINRKLVGVSNHIKTAGFLFILLVLVGLAGCMKTSVYERNLQVDPGGWDIDDSLEFAVEVTDTLTPVNFLFTLRHNTDYRYSNIYFFLNTYYPDNRYSRDTIQILLAGKDGKWFGKGFGRLKEVDVMLKDKLVFPRSGIYRFSFVQAMREQSLSGIEDIGIRIEKSQE